MVAGEGLWPHGRMSEATQRLSVQHRQASVPHAITQREPAGPVGVAGTWGKARHVYVGPCDHSSEAKLTGGSQ